MVRANESNATDPGMKLSQAAELQIKKIQEEQKNVKELKGPEVPYNEKLAKGYLKILSLPELESIQTIEGDELLGEIRTCVRNSTFYQSYLNALRSHFNKNKAEAQHLSLTTLQDLTQFLDIALSHEDLLPQTIELVAEFLSVLDIDQSAQMIVRVVSQFQSRTFEALLTHLSKKVTNKTDYFARLQEILTQGDTDALFNLMLFNIGHQLESSDVESAIRGFVGLTERGGLFIASNSSRVVQLVIKIANVSSMPQVEALIKALELVQGSGEINWVTDLLKAEVAKALDTQRPSIDLISARKKFITETIESELSSLPPSSCPPQVIKCIELIMELQDLIKEPSKTTDGPSFSGSFELQPLLETVSKLERDLNIERSKVAEMEAKLVVELQDRNEAREKFLPLFQELNSKFEYLANFAKQAEAAQQKPVDTSAVRQAVEDYKLSALDQLRAENDRLKASSGQYLSEIIEQFERARHGRHQEGNWMGGGRTFYAPPRPPTRPPPR